MSADWQTSLLADAAARLDSIASVLADRVLRDDDAQLAALIALVDRVVVDLDRLHLEHEAT